MTDGLVLENILRRASELLCRLSRGLGRFARLLLSPVHDSYRNDYKVTDEEENRYDIQRYETVHGVVSGKEDESGNDQSCTRDDDDVVCTVERHLGLDLRFLVPLSPSAFYCSCHFAKSFFTI